ncbi:MAG: Panacea domain-containing protein [Chloroherpetonaceae bacterium]
MQEQQHDISREKLLNAILFFAEKVKFPHKIKLFKLLFYFDFKHLEETGRSVTHADYVAWKFGPVPKTLYDELKNERVPEDFKQALAIERAKEEDGTETLKFIAKQKPDMSVFTPRQKKILENLAETFKDATAKMMIEATHEPKSPWRKTLNTKGEGAIIERDLALSKESPVTPEYVKAFEKERQEILKNLST